MAETEEPRAWVLGVEQLGILFPLVCARVGVTLWKLSTVSAKADNTHTSDDPAAPLQIDL